MSERQETIADIIAEKRRRADEIERDCAEKMKRGEMVSDCYARELVADIRREANHLDAAHRREYGMQKSVIDNLTKALKEIADIVAEMKREAAQMFPALPIAVLQLATRLEAPLKRVRELTKPAENVNSGAAVDSRDNSGNCAKLREAMVEILEYIESFHKYIIPGKRKKLTTLFAVADTIRSKARAALAAPPRNCDIYLTEEAVDAATVTVRDCEACPRIDMEAPCVFCMVRWLLAPAKEGGAK